LFHSSQDPDDAARRCSGWRAALAGALLGSASGCAAPLLHPLRASNGPVAEIASTVTVDAGRRGECDEDVCRDTDDRNLALSSLQFSGGYSRVFARRFGVMGGLYAPAQQGWGAPAAIWTFFTVQNAFASAGVGPELGSESAALAIGGELQPWGAAPAQPRFGVYGRWTAPYYPDLDDLEGQTRAFEFGGRLRFAFFFLGYALQERPNAMVKDFDGSSYAERRHLMTIGLTLDRDTVRAFSGLGGSSDFKIGR